MSTWKAKAIRSKKIETNLLHRFQTNAFHSLKCISFSWLFWKLQVLPGGIDGQQFCSRLTAGGIAWLRVSGLWQVCVSLQVLDIHRKRNMANRYSISKQMAFIPCLGCWAQSMWKFTPAHTWFLLPILLTHYFLYALKKFLCICVRECGGLSRTLPQQYFAHKLWRTANAFRRNRWIYSTEIWELKIP